MEFNHKSVLLQETIESLNIKPEGIYIDATLGGAGHSLQIAQRLTTGQLIGIDRDENAIKTAQDRLYPYKSNVVLVRDNYTNAEAILNDLGIKNIDGCIMDLGVSSHQLDEAERGFSYMADARLDMRMDNRGSLTAYSVVNSYSEEELYGLIKDYGEERWAKRIAAFIVENRKEKPIETTFELVAIIKKAIPKKMRDEGPHPAKRTFQAIRIEVNDELDQLGRAVKNIIERLSPGGRISVITFHSLEDRIIKHTFKNSENPCTCPKDFPVCVCGLKPLGKTVTRKPVLPSEDEVKSNPRSRSAKLRIFERGAN